MLQNGKPVQSLWLGGERFDKYSQDDEDALAKYKKLQSFIGTTVHVSTSDKITDIDIKPGEDIQDPTPQDGYVNVDEIIWDGDHDVDLIGLVDVVFNTGYGSSSSSTDHCIIDHESI